MNTVRAPAAGLRLAGARSAPRRSRSCWRATSVTLNGTPLVLEVDDHVLDGQARGVLDALDQVAPQPAGVLGGVGRDDDLVRAALGDGVHRREERVGVADFAGRLDALVGDRRRARGRRAPGPIRARPRRRSRAPPTGWLCGTTRRNAVGPAAVRARTASSSFSPPSVRLATTRTSLMRARLPHSLGALTTPAPDPEPRPPSAGAGAKMPCTAPGTPYS